MPGVSRPLTPSQPAAFGSASATPLNIPEGITSLAHNLRLLSAEHPVLGEDDCEQLGVLQGILNSRSLLQRQMALEAEHIEAEHWNLDTVSQLAALAEKLDRIPFDGLPPSPFPAVNTQSAKGKERAEGERLVEDRK